MSMDKISLSFTITAPPRMLQSKAGSVYNRVLTCASHVARSWNLANTNKIKNTLDIFYCTFR